MQSCGTCTECCKGILNITVNDITYSDGNKCSEWCESGCKSYDSRPIDCHNYNCGWRSNEKAPEWMRPDRAKVFINDSTSDTVYYEGKAVPFIVPIADDIPEHVMKYLIEDAIEHNKPFRYIHKPDNNTIAIGAFGDDKFKAFVKDLGLPKG